MMTESGKHGRLSELERQYRRDGFVVLPEFLPSDLVRELQQVTAAYARRAERGELFDVIGNNGRQVLRRITNPEEANPVYDRAMRYAPLIDYLAVDAFPLFHKYDWQAFNARIPHPVSKQDARFTTASIFDLQAELKDGVMGCVFLSAGCGMNTIEETV